MRSFLINWRLYITGPSRTFDWVHHALSGDSFTKANYNHEQKQTWIPVNKCYIARNCRYLDTKGFVVILLLIHWRSKLWHSVSSVPHFALLIVVSHFLLQVKTMHELKYFTVLQWKSPRTIISSVIFPA